VTELRAGGAGVPIPVGKRYLSLHRKDEIASVDPPSLLFNGLAVLSGAKVSGVSRRSNARIKNEWSPTSTPPALTRSDLVS
jgi:hypothetical protein